MDKFRVRLNCIDHYQAVPTRYDPLLRKDVRASQVSKGPKFPVIRIFGATETGQKVCAHVHGAFPYLYVEYDGALGQEEVGAFMYRLHLSIDHALAVSYRRDQYGDNARYVARITLVKGVPFYGFHVGYRYFLKVYMFNPIVMTRLADLLQQGVIMKRKFQPFEAHLQYLLQFMTDYNLYGCDYLETSRVYFRAPVPEHSEESNALHLWHSQSVSKKNITDDPELPRVSHCSIEVDICVHDILNRKIIKERPLHHDFIERFAPLPNDMKLVHSMAGLWRDETKRRKRQLAPDKQRGSPFPPEVHISMSADPRNSKPQEWIHEDEYVKEVQKLIDQESGTLQGLDLNFDTFVHADPQAYAIKTALKAVEDLHPSNLVPVLGLPDDVPHSSIDPAGSIDVDEQNVTKAVEADADFFPDDSDEEVLRQVLKRAKGEDVKAGPADKEIFKEVQDDTATSERPVDISKLCGIYPSCLQSGKLERRAIPRDVLIGTTKDPECLSKLNPNGDFRGNISPTLNAVASKRCRSEVPVASGSPKRLKSVSGSAAVQMPNVTGSFSVSDEKSDVAFELSAKSSPNLPASQFLGDMQQPNGRFKSHEMPNRPAGTSESVKSAHRPSQRSNEPPKSALKPSRGPPTSTSAGSENGSKSRVSFAPRHGAKILPHEKSPDESKDVGKRRAPPIKDLEKPSALQIRERKLARWANPASMKGADAAAPVLTSDKWGKRASHVKQSKADARKNMKAYSPRRVMYKIAISPPDPLHVMGDIVDLGMPRMLWQDAHYSLLGDVPDRPRQYAGREYEHESTAIPFLPEFDASGTSQAAFGVKTIRLNEDDWPAKEDEPVNTECSFKRWDFADIPPSYSDVEKWYGEKHTQAAKKGQNPKSVMATQRPNISQIQGATPKNKHDFKYTQNGRKTSVEHEVQYMSTMSLEVHVNTRGKFVPNPEEDEIQCLFWALKSDEAVVSTQDPANAWQSGAIILDPDNTLIPRFQKQLKGEVIAEPTELDLMNRMVDIVRLHDPDILTGYEVHGSSWGYVIERARCMFDFNLCDEFSRMRTQAHGRFGKDSDRWGFNTTSTIRVTGRHMINVWRAMRGELNLLQYTMENVAWHLLHRRIPHYSWKVLTDCYRSGKPRDIHKVLKYYEVRTKMDIEILEANELIARTSEQARLLGVDFFSVFSRGSQFKVESIMFRIAKPENFILVSPNRKQVGGQNALECLPLVMEPQSAFYSSPLLVLDFQSLYPSVMIAYNYCYSTFLGRITNWRGMNKMGFTEYQRQKGLLALLKDHINIAPNGMMYSKVNIRKSLLAKMLTEILETRVMVKSGMKKDKDDKALQQLLNNRQLALKLLANVTYGYTSASFSGRMPCSEIADSIVQTGRETLERAIAFIHSMERWNAEVVYGDTDSLFVYLKGRTKAEAFEIGNEIAAEVTKMNPQPIKLKFEKVYHPCVLLAKKRYVGYKYESKDQTAPDFDAKGIETVRRDGTPAEQKIEEKALRLLFETADLSQVKDYFQEQCSKIMNNRVSVQDFCFAREVKLGTYANKGPPPAGALISTKKMLEDSRAEPQYGERVPYVVISGAPGARLIDRCVAPEEMLTNPHWQLDAEYYISKNLIPPLERIFNLTGADVRQWYDEMPKVQTNVEANLGKGQVVETKGRFTLESYMQSGNCLVCQRKFYAPVNTRNKDRIPMMCPPCGLKPSRSLLRLERRVAVEEKRFEDMLKVCRSCAGLGPLEEVNCDSKDCPVFWSRAKAGGKAKEARERCGPAIRGLAAGEDMSKLTW